MLHSELPTIHTRWLTALPVEQTDSVMQGTAILQRHDFFTPA
jgi:hypothetical protein